MFCATCSVAVMALILIFARCAALLWRMMAAGRHLSGDRSQAPVVGKGVRVGNAAVLAGVTVGGAVIGTNAGVTNPVPAYEIWGGNPARKIGERR